MDKKQEGAVPEVTLPLYNRFKNPIEAGRTEGNVHSGSLGTDPDRGTIVGPTFHYKVRLRKNEETGECRFYVTSFVRLGWDHRCETVDHREADFPDGDEGFAAVREFLNTAAREGLQGQ